ncbi:unnamed protein product, partial [Effrenium voratum]
AAPARRDKRVPNAKGRPQGIQVLQASLPRNGLHEEIPLQADSCKHVLPRFNVAVFFWLLGRDSHCKELQKYFRGRRDDRLCASIAVCCIRQGESFHASMRRCGSS